MNYRILHELPQRIRICLKLPKKGFSCRAQQELEGVFLVIEGIDGASFNRRTGSLLVWYTGNHATRIKLLKTIQEIPLTLASVRKGDVKRDALEQKRRGVVLAGVFLMVRPFIPLPLRPWFTLYGIVPVIMKGLKVVLGRRLTIDALDAAAVGISFGRRDYLSASVIAFFLKIGDYLEERIRQRSRESLLTLFQVGNEWVWVRRNGRDACVNIKCVTTGEHVVVMRGSSIPVDGVVLEGSAMVNQSSMTGELSPVAKRKGLTVYAGTALEEGFLVVKAVRVGDETRMSRIVRVIEESESLKAEVQSHTEKLANRIVPYTFLLSGVIYFLTGNLTKVASVLLVDYSCAIKLSTPLAIMSAMVTAARRGILVKGGKSIEKLAGSNVFILDKTGTLTEARPKVVDVVPYNGFSREYILRNAACVEEHFPHPVASAVVKKAEEEGLVHEELHTEIEYIVAHGIVSRTYGERILVGSKHFMEDCGVNVECAQPLIKSFADKGYSILYVAIGMALGGIMAFEDTLREDARTFLDGLRSSGVGRIVMLTGDNDAAAKNVADKLGIEEFYSQVFPEKKAEIIKELKDKGWVVAMVGDGINDSPALSYADVGISMKHGADIAKEACNVLLMDVRLERIIEARKMAQDAMLRIRQNFKYIVGINTVLIGLGISGFTTPVFSAFMHNMTTFLVSANSLRPYRTSSP